MKKKRNKIASAVITFSVILCMAGCGNASRPVNGTAENIEEELPDNMDASDVADMLESGMSVDEIVDRVEEIKEEATTDKPAEVTASPEPTATASPTPTATPEPTSTPSPAPTATPEPHVHQYTETVIKTPTCAESGEKQLVCQGCGDSKTEAIPATGEHNWVEETTILHHEALGHVEEVQVQVGTSAGYCTYACAVCGAEYDSPSSLREEHQKSFIGIDNVHAGANTIIYDHPGEPIYETQSQWIEDTPAWDEQIVVNYKCSICGATK